MNQARYSYAHRRGLRGARRVRGGHTIEAIDTAIRDGPERFMRASGFLYYYIHVQCSTLILLFWVPLARDRALVSNRGQKCNKG